MLVQEESNKTGHQAQHSGGRILRGTTRGGTVKLSAAILQEGDIDGLGSIEKLLEAVAVLHHLSLEAAIVAKDGAAVLFIDRVRAYIEVVQLLVTFKRTEDAPYAADKGMSELGVADVEMRGRIGGLS